jgi:tetratricopeptide (TPR) repeat protein
MPLDLVNGTESAPVTHRIWHGPDYQSALTPPVVAPGRAHSLASWPPRSNIGRMATDQSIQDLLAAGYAAIADAGLQTGDFTRAREMLQQAHDEAASTADAASLAQALNGLGLIAHHENLGRLRAGSAPADPDIAAEEKLFRLALAEGQAAGDAASTAQSQFGLGLVFQVLRRDWMTAMPYYWQALGAVTTAGSEAGAYLRSEVHRHVGFYFAFEDGQAAEAVRHLQISLDLREELGDQRHLVSGLVALGEAELAAGNPDRAVELLGRAADLARAQKLLPHRVEDAERALREAEGARDAGG